VSWIPFAHKGYMLVPYQKKYVLRKIGFSGPEIRDAKQNLLMGFLRQQTTKH